MSAIQEPFAAGVSLAHRLDPRAKIAVAVPFTVLMAVSTSYPVVLTGLALALAALALARLPLKEVAARLLVVNGFILVLWLVLPFTYPGLPLGHLGPLAPTREGLLFTGLITLKSNAIILALMALVATVPVVTLGQAMHNLRLPDKLCHLLLFTYRYLYVFEAEFHRLLQAIKVRGFQPRTALHTYRTYAYLAAVLLVRSYDRADRVYQAMRCRGFNGAYYSLKTFAWQGRDSAFLAAAAPALAALLLLEWRLPGLL